MGSPTYWPPADPFLTQMTPPSLRRGRAQLPRKGGGGGGAAPPSRRRAHTARAHKPLMSGLAAGGASAGPAQRAVRLSPPPGPQGYPACV